MPLTTLQGTGHGLHPQIYIARPRVAGPLKQPSRYLFPLGVGRGHMVKEAVNLPGEFCVASGREDVGRGAPAAFDCFACGY